MRKTQLSVSPKKITGVIRPSAGLDTLSDWAQLYYQVHVTGSPEKTIEAKEYDMKLFLDFFSSQVGADQVDLWTPSVSKAFRSDLARTYKATTINRVLATLRHFASWIGGYRKFMAGHPFSGVKDLVTDEPAWKGIPKRQVMLMKSACDIRLASATRKDQDPLLETTVFYVLLHTGMRESELVSINIGQYHDKGFHQVKRKGNKVTTKIYLPKEARKWVDRYLDRRREGHLKKAESLKVVGKKKGLADLFALSDQDPLLVSSIDSRLTPRTIRYTSRGSPARHHLSFRRMSASGSLRTCSATTLENR